MADVFISYHEKSAGELAAQIARTLEASDISCWYAKRDIPPGGDFPRTIPPQIDACKVFLLVLTKEAQTSEHIGNELALAFSRWNRKKDITIFPVKIGDFEEESWIKYYLVRAQILKCAVLDTERIQELARRVAKRLNRELKSPAPPKATPQPVPKPNLPTPKQQPVSAPPAKIIERGECGDNVTYTFDKNGVLTISGKGAMRDFIGKYPMNVYEERPWESICPAISHVEIQDGITSIGSAAFLYCAGLTSITIPDSVISIGRMAFIDCTGLTSITIPDNVISIEGKAFTCAGLTSVTIPDSVTKIEPMTFYGCTGLTSVSIPNSVISIEGEAFAYTGLTSVTIPDSVTKIKSMTFYGCTGLRNVNIPEKVTSIGCWAFENCTGLTSLTIPDSVTSIGWNAFKGCTRLRSVSIPAKAKITKNGIFRSFPPTVRIERRA